MSIKCAWDDIPQIGKCKICSKQHYQEFQYEKLGVCASCVVSLYDMYSIAHSGRPSNYIEHRRSKKRKKISSKTRLDVFRRNGFKCVECHSIDNLQVDHIIPIAKGGEDKFDNFQTLCGVCNRKKGAKL